MRQRRLDPGRTWVAISLALFFFCATGVMGTLSAAAQETAPGPVERTEAIPSVPAQNAAASALSPSVVTCTAPLAVCTNTTINAPCSITAAGSYKLSGNVSQATTTYDAIEIKAGDVTLDLEGYRVYGLGTGSCVGINACQSATNCQSNIIVRNGSVTNFGGPGIQLGVPGYGAAQMATQLRSYNNGVSGGGGGILLGDSSSTFDNISECNGHKNAKCTGTDSSGGDGIDCGTSCMIEGNVANGNANYGIFTYADGMVANNEASAECTGSPTCSDNQIYGLYNGGGTGYGKNVMENNTLFQANGGVGLCGNMCNGTLCGGATSACN